MTDEAYTADVIVVGGGTAGCAIAARLVRDGAQVIVLEAGPDYGRLGSSGWPADLLDGRHVATSHDWGYMTTGHGGQPLAQERCRVIGGCSSHNGATLNVGWAGDYDRWARDGSPGWDAANLVPEFDEVLSQFNARKYGEDEIQPFQRAVINTAIDAGLPRADDFESLYGGAGVGCSPVAITRDGIRVNSAFAYLDSQRDGDRLQVIGDALVDRVLISDGQVDGVNVLVGGVCRRLRADLVVLSAGVFGTPEILLRSGIGAETELASLGIRVLHPLEGVGRNLHDQPAAQVEYSASRRLLAQLEAFSEHGLLVEEQAIIKLRSPFAGDAPYDLHINPWIEPDPRLEGGWRCIIPVSLLRPRSRGSVTLSSPDPHRLATTDTGYLRDPADMQTLAWGVRWLIERLGQDPLAELLDMPLAAPETDDDIEPWISINHRHYWHPVGSCRMGPSTDAQAVIDHRGAVHGLHGLHVADASVFPDMPRGTTALPTALVGHHVGRCLTTVHST